MTNDFQVEFFSFNYQKQCKLSVCKKVINQVRVNGLYLGSDKSDIFSPLLLLFAGLIVGEEFQRSVKMILENANCSLDIDDRSVLFSCLDPIFASEIY